MIIDYLKVVSLYEALSLKVLPSALLILKVPPQMMLPLRSLMILSLSLLFLFGVLPDFQTSIAPEQHMRQYDIYNLVINGYHSCISLYLG